jgi:glycine hydroxymethyltransferase
MMTMSTHKTLPGPQHGMIVANPRDEKTERKLIYGVFPGVLSNHHLNAMAALGVALAEHIEFGSQYAEQIVRNSKALGQALYERGFDVLAEKKGFTESHTLVVDVREHGGGKFAAEALEQAYIIVNKNLLPWDDVNTALDPSGLRLGTQELTRIGMKEGDMQDVAEFMKRVVIDKEDPKRVGMDVAEFKKDFQTIHYCFAEGTMMYDYEELIGL